MIGLLTIVVVEGVKHIKSMANLLLTTDCQRKCCYCFAQGDRNKHMEFTWDNFITAANFVATIEPKLINLLGGEPTLHKDFPKMLEYLLLNDFVVQVFTNGLADNKCLDKVSEVLRKITLREDQLKFSVNVNQSKEREIGETEKQVAFFERFHKLAFPAFTIHEKDMDLSFLIDLVNKHNLDPAIRLGLAMPIIGVKNKYLPIKHYRNVAESIVRLVDNSPGITVTFDCGFPLCMFDMAEIQRLSKSEENDFMFSCGQPVDIYPDLTATNCYPLSKLHKVNIQDFKDIVELYKFFQDGFMTPTGIYGQKCLDCSFYRKVCSGGCRGFYKPEQQGGN